MDSVLSINATGVFACPTYSGSLAMGLLRQHCLIPHTKVSIRWIEGAIQRGEKQQRQIPVPLAVRPLPDRTGLSVLGQAGVLRRTSGGVSLTRRHMRAKERDRENVRERERVRERVRHRDITTERVSHPASGSAHMSCDRTYCWDTDPHSSSVFSVCLSPSLLPSQSEWSAC